MFVAGMSVLLTGASGGLGEAIADVLYAQGAKLTLTARRREILESLAERTHADVVVADLTNRDDLDTLLSDIGKYDIIVANAGIGNGSTINEVNATEVDDVIDVNLRAPIHMTTAFIAQRGDKESHVVLIGSLAGIVSSPNSFMYNATKFGLRGFAHSARIDLEDTNMGISLIAPGFISDAGMFADSGIDLPKSVRTKTPADVGKAVLKAISENKAEVFVSPIELRAAAQFGGTAPGIARALQNKLGLNIE